MSAGVSRYPAGKIEKQADRRFLELTDAPWKDWTGNTGGHCLETQGHWLLGYRAMEN